MVEIKLINGDCLEELESLEKEADCSITDPPYNISGKTTDIGFSDRKDMSMNFGDWDESEIHPKDWVPLISKALTDTGVFISFYDYNFMEHLTIPIRNSGLHMRQKAYWHKANPLPRVETTKWQDAIEEIAIATKNEGRGHNFQHHRQRHNVIETPIVQGQDRYEHPTQKPEEVIETLVKWWTEKGDTVLDPFAGSGTTPAVCKRMGRDCIAIERDKDFYEIMEERVEKAEEHTDDSVFDY